MNKMRIYIVVMLLWFFVFWGYVMNHNNTFKRVKVGQIWMEIYNVENPYKMVDTTYSEIIEVNGRYAKYMEYSTRRRNDTNTYSGKKRYIKWGAKRIKK